MKIRASILALSLLGMAGLNAHATVMPCSVAPVNASEPSIEVEVVQEEAEPEFVANPQIPLDADLQKRVRELCESYGVKECTIYGIIQHESRFKADVVGDKGRSIGLMQIQPRWHKARMQKLGVTDLYDPYSNVAVGVDYFAELLAVYDGDELKALTAYNRGIAGANKFFANGGTISAYAKEVFEFARSIE